MYAAYKYVVVAVMLTEINSIGDKLGLPMRFPLTQADVRNAIVFPPKGESFGARLDIDNFSFSCIDNIRLCFIWRILKPWGRISVAERNDMLVKEESLIDTNGAYRTAARWLEALSVDVRSLERERPL